MVTALDQPSDRVRGLQAGADDFLTKPVSDIALIARVRSLTRLKMMTDELRMRATTSREIGIESAEREAITEQGTAAASWSWTTASSSYERIVAMLDDGAHGRCRARPGSGAFSARPRAITIC